MSTVPTRSWKWATFGLASTEHGPAMKSSSQINQPHLIRLPSLHRTRIFLVASAVVETVLQEVFVEEHLTELVLSRYPSPPALVNM